MKMKQIEEQILDLLKEKKSFLSGDYIINNIDGIGTKIQLRNHISKMRKNCLPIVAGNKGYKYTEDKKEIQDYILSLFGRANDMIHSCNGLRSYLDEL